jgi:hypothetical protein
LLADEFQRDVERFGPRPACVGGEATHSVEECANPLPNFFVDIERDEESHDETRGSVFGLRFSANLGAQTG